MYIPSCSYHKTIACNFLRIMTNAFFMSWILFSIFLILARSLIKNIGSFLNVTILYLIGMPLRIVACAQDFLWRRLGILRIRRENHKICIGEKVLKQCKICIQNPLLKNIVIWIQNNSEEMGGKKDERGRIYQTRNSFYR